MFSKDCGNVYSCDADQSMELRYVAEEAGSEEGRENRNSL